MTTITIVHESGTDVVDVSDEYFVEEIDVLSEAHFDIRVWHSDPAIDDSDYTDYRNGSIIEVDPENEGDDE